MWRCCPPDGLLVACADEAGALTFARNRQIMGLPVATYGLREPGAYWRAANVAYTTDQMQFDVYYKDHCRGA